MIAPLNAAPSLWGDQADVPDDGSAYEAIACRFAASASVDMIPTITSALAELCSQYGGSVAVLARLGHPTLARNARGEPVAIDSFLPTNDMLASRHEAMAKAGSIRKWISGNADCMNDPAGIIWHWRSCVIGEGGADQVLIGWQGRNDEVHGERLGRIFQATLLQRVAALIGAGLRRAGQSEARRELLRRLSATQRLDVASTTALAMAHNLNNVLAAMLGHTEIALEFLQGQPRGHSAVMAIKNASERASELIESILGLGEREVAEAPLSLGQLCLDTVELIRPAIPDRIALELSDVTDGVMILGRAAQLQQVILNLIRNAVQAIPGEGRVSLVLSILQGQENMPSQVGIISSAPYLVLRVVDDGVGIAPEARDTIFRPFVTTRPSGTGLGLSAAAQIVSAHEGAIRLQAAENRGAVFEVWLPQRVEIANDRAHRGDGQPVILVVSGPMRERLEDQIAALGYDPRTIENLSDAVVFLKTTGAEGCPVMIYSEQLDLDACLTDAEFFRLECPVSPLTMLVPGRMPTTPFGSYSVRQTWMAGAGNSGAIAACVRLMTNLSAHNTEGMVN